MYTKNIIIIGALALLKAYMKWTRSEIPLVYEQLTKYLLSINLKDIHYQRRVLKHLDTAIRRWRLL